MARFDIYSKDGKEIRYSGCPKYNGSYLKVSFLDFGNISVPESIAWQVGDYVDYSRTGKRYRLYATPTVKKQARAGASGESFVYQGVQFHAKTHDLETAPFKDFVKNDNGIHFSTRSAVSTYENVYGIVERIQKNLDEFYPGEWDVHVYGDLDDDFKEKITESRNFSVEGSCLDACNKLYDIWGIGWLHVVENGKDVLVFGRPNKRDVANTSDMFVYGKGNGLTAIQKSANNLEDIVTRLFVYGSSRNLPSRHYNNLNIKDAKSVDIQHLMIPVEYWGKTDGLPDASKAYFEDAASVKKLGLIPKSAYFEGGDYPEIYPTISGVTIKDVREVMSPDDKYYPNPDIYDGAERIDKVKDVINPNEDGSAEFPEFIESPEVARKEVNAYLYTYRFFSAVLPGPGTYIFRPNQKGYIEEKADKDRQWSQFFIKCSLLDSQGKSIFSKYFSVPLNTDSNPLKRTFDTSKLECSIDVEDDLYQEGIRLVVNIQLSKILIGGSRFYPIYFYINSGKYPYPSPEYSGPKADFQLFVRQLGFDINEMASLSTEGKCTVAMNTGMCAGRQFPVVSAKYRKETDDWELGLNRQTDESLGEKFPNSKYPIAVNDEFVLLDIAMPDIYISLAEQRLYKEGQALYKDISKVSPYYEPNIDAKVMASSGRSLSEGMYMHIYDEDIVESEDGNDYVLVDSLVISEGEAAIPTYKVTLREQKHKSFQQATNEAISDLKDKTSSIGAGKINTEYANRAGSADYASDSSRWSGYKFSDMMNQPVKSTDVVSFKGVITDEVISSDYTPGLLGAGHYLGKDNAGDSVLDVDEITVRKRMTVYEMLIQQYRHQGGILFYTPASIECTKVEETEDGYKCYFDNKEGAIPNLFVVEDQARCQRFDIGNTKYKYYWRYVSEIGDDYILLSKSDCDEGSDLPEEGDNIIQLGNRTDRTRMAAKVTVMVGENTPRDEYYEGIDSYNLSGKLVTVVGVNDGKVGIFTEYGRFRGDVVIGSGSSGLENLSEWQGKQQEISDAKEVAQNAQTAVDNIQVGGRNLLRRTEFLKTVINENSQYTHVSYFPTVPIKPNTEYVFSVEKTEILAGSGFDQFSVALYDNVTETIFSRWLVPISSERKSIVLRSPNTVTANTYFIIYSGVIGETAGKQIRLTNFKLEEGNKATAWSAAPEDVAEATQQEIDKASLYRKTTIIDATGLDQNKYYLVTLPADSKVRTHYEIDVALNPEVSGKPEWAGHNTGSFVLNVRWSAYGNGWGTTSTQRIVESFHYQWTDTDKYGTVIPAGEISQMTRSSREYIYVRGGAKYPITVWGYKHNNIVPTLHTTSLTLLGEVKESPKSELRTIPKAYMSDLDRLDQLFPKSNLVANGAVVGQMLGVTDKDNNNKIIAGLNGSNNFKDKNHGKVLLFGGANGLTTSGLNQAKTLLFEDGYFVTSNAYIVGSLYAKNGQIGNFFTDSAGSAIMAQKKPNDDLTYEIYLGERMHYHVSDKSEENLDFTFSLYDRSGKYEDIFIDKNGNSSSLIGTYYKIGANIKLECNSTRNYSYLAALNISASGTGAKDMHAIYCPAGTFAGLRPYCRTVTASPIILTEFDHTIFIGIASTLNFHLPYDAEDGQEYIVVSVDNSNDRRINFYCSDAIISCPLDGVWSATSTWYANRGIIYCLKARGNWYLYRIK